MSGGRVGVGLGVGIVQHFVLVEQEVGEVVVGVVLEVSLILVGVLKVNLVVPEDGVGLLESVGELLLHVVHGGCLYFELLQFFSQELFPLQEVLLHFKLISHRS